LKRRSTFLLVFLLLAGAWHVFLWSLGRTPDLRSLAGDEQTYWARAEVYQAGGEPAVDLLWPPFYGRFLSLTWWPMGRSSRLLTEGAQVLLLAVAAFLFFRLARRQGLEESWALVAAGALFVLPEVASFAHYFWPEVLHLALFLGALELLRWRQARAAFWAAAAAGVLFGLALLTKSLLSAFLPVLLLIEALSSARGKRLGRLALIAGGLLLTIGPTLWHHHQVKGRFTIADSSTFNLWVGLNDVSRQSHSGSIAWREFQAWRDSAPEEAGRDALLRQQILAKVQDDGIGTILRRQLGRQYFRLFEKDCYFIDQLPAGSLEPEGQGYHGLAPGLAAALRGLTWGSHLLLLALAGFGLALMPRPSRADPQSFLLPTFLLYNLLIFLGLHVKSRYLVQMLPFLLLLAGWAVQKLSAHLRGNERIGPGPLLAGSACAALLLFLATAGPWLDRVAPTP